MVTRPAAASVEAAQAERHIVVGVVSRVELRVRLFTITRLGQKRLLGSGRTS